MSVLGPGSPNRLSHRIAAGQTEQRRDFVVTQSGLIPAQLIAHGLARLPRMPRFLRPLKIGLKVLTHPLKDLLGSDS
jgi:hypothetical protein